MLDVMIKRSSLKRNSEVVYSQLVKELEESIRRGELAPGEQIPPENLLAEQFGISRSRGAESSGEPGDRGEARGEGDVRAEPCGGEGPGEKRDPDDRDQHPDAG